MAEDDINVVFAAEDEGLTAYIERLRAQFGQLDATAVAEGQKISAAFQKMGIDANRAFEMMGKGQDQAKNQLAQYLISLEKTADSTKKVTGATNEATEGMERFGRSGINVGNMLERIAIRLVIFEALRLAIQGVKYAFDQISNLQQARLQFDAMADSADNLAGRFKYLQESAAAGFVPIEKATAAYEALKDLGVSENTAMMATRDLDKWSQILGIDAVKLAEALGQVAEGTASLQQMRLVTRMMGEQGEAGRALVQNLVDLEKQQKAVDVATAATEKTMAQELRTAQQASAEIERHVERGLSFTERVLTREAEARRARGLETRTPTQVVTEAFEGTGAGRGVRLPYAEMMEYRRGIEAIAQEQGMSQAQVHRLIRQQILDYHDVLAAARERTGDEMRNLTQLDEARRAIMESQKTAVAGDVAGAKAQLAAMLPQAVTAPPAGLWSEFSSSIKGQTDALKTSIDTGLGSVVSAIDRAKSSTDGLYALLAGGT